MVARILMFCVVTLVFTGLHAVPNRLVYLEISSNTAEDLNSQLVELEITGIRPRIIVPPDQIIAEFEGEGFAPVLPSFVSYIEEEGENGSMLGGIAARDTWRLPSDTFATELNFRPCPT